MFNAYALPLAERQANRETVRVEMAERPEAYAANLRKLYETNSEARQLVDRDILKARKGTNTVARAGQLVASEVFHCTGSWAAEAWHKLTRYEQGIIDAAFEREIERLRTL